MEGILIHAQRKTLLPSFLPSFRRCLQPTTRTTPQLQLKTENKGNGKNPLFQSARNVRDLESANFACNILLGHLLEVEITYDWRRRRRPRCQCHGILLQRTTLTERRTDATDADKTCPAHLCGRSTAAVTYLFYNRAFAHPSSTPPMSTLRRNFPSRQVSLLLLNSSTLIATLPFALDFFSPRALSVRPSRTSVVRPSKVRNLSSSVRPSRPFVETD